MLGHFVNQEVFIVTKFETNLRRKDRGSRPPPPSCGNQSANERATVGRLCCCLMENRMLRKNYKLKKHYDSVT
jgi:hypothetical protein